MNLSATVTKAALAGLLLIGANARAQSNASGPQGSNPDSDVLKLDPFAVREASDQAYGVPDATVATKLDAPVMETPVSVQVITQQALKDQGILRLGDALVNVSGVIPTNESGGTSDSFSIRGFDANEMTYEDGMRADQYTNGGFSIDMANVQEVQVAKGPASVLYGQSEPGGTVNIVTKQPMEKPLFDFEQTFGSFKLYRASLDASGPLDASKTWLYRLNVAYEDSGSFRSFVSQRRLILYPTLEWRPSSRTRVVLEAKSGSGYEVYDPGIPFYNGSVAPVPYYANFAEPGSNKGPIRDQSIKLTMTHKVSDAWTLKAAVREGYISGPVPNYQGYAGDPDASGDLYRFGFVTGFFKHWTTQAIVDLTGKFDLLGAHNTFIAGVDYYRDDGRYDANTFGLPTINIFAPVYGQPYQLPDPSTDFVVFNGEKAFGAYVQDFLELPHHLFLLAGFRYDNATTYDSGYGVVTSVDDHPTPTPRFGVLWQPRPNLSLYASYTGSYGDTPLGVLTANGVPLKPESAQQYEAGIKSEWLDKRLTATVAVYQVTKENIPAPDPHNPAYSITIGQARSRGVELDVTGQLAPGWKVIAAYSYIDAITTDDPSTPSYQGLRFANVPFNSASLWSTYDFDKGVLGGLRLGIGVQARGQELDYESPTGVSYSPIAIKGFATESAMASYSWKAKKWKQSLQVNIENLSNTRYFEALGYATAYPGAPFAINVTLRVSY
jgi:iron complex outermembrane recepter protein